LVGPVAAALALAGLGWLLLGRDARPFRALGWSVLVVLAVFVVSVSKPYYFSPAYALLFPAAGVALERWTSRRLTRTARATVLLLAASILFAAPLAKPLLAVDDYVRYARALGEEPGTDEHHELGRLPQFFADMHGWRELAEDVAEVLATLPAGERERACVYGNNYGEAGAIDFFGPALGLPPAISGHNSYWLWGPGECTGEVVLILGGRRDNHLRAFRSVEAAAVHRCVDCMPYENDLTIWVARGIRQPIGELWDRVRHYD